MKLKKMLFSDFSDFIFNKKWECIDPYIYRGNIKDSLFAKKLKPTSIENIGKSKHIIELEKLRNTKENKIATYIFDNYAEQLNADNIDGNDISTEEYYDTNVYFNISVCFVENGKIYFEEHIGINDIKTIMDDVYKKFGIDRCYAFKTEGELRQKNIKMESKPLYIVGK